MCGWLGGSERAVLACEAYKRNLRPAKLRERQQLLLVGQAARVEAMVALASGVKVPVERGDMKGE